MNNKAEILAPVGGSESLMAAVRAGADAVYFGAQQFNARRNADNFDDDGIKNAIDYCKINNVKSYLTLNTIIKDGEMSEALELVSKVWRYGIDAVIVQDLGLAKLLRQYFPNLPLHGSTQLSVHSPAALGILKKMGFTRVVPAREMSRAELYNFCKAAKELDIEVEVFIHGALCMCLSGQCYFSAFLGGRSANRGLCAGTCRLPFSAKGGTGYDLSLKDLSLIPYLDQLSNMGVCSFKIEGRMKRPEYVACTVDAVRQALDYGNVSTDTANLLEQVFSRGGFTDGYYMEKLGRDMFGVRSDQDKQLSADVLAKTHELYRHERQKLPLSIDLLLKNEKPAQLTVRYCEYHATVFGDIPEVAINRPLTEGDATAALSKLGGTCYFAEDIRCDIDGGITLALSKLKAMRKTAVEMLNKTRLAEREGIALPGIDVKRRVGVKPVSFFARFADLEQCFEADEYLPRLCGYSLPAEIMASKLPEVDGKGKEILLKACAELPRGAFDDDETRILLEKLKNYGVQKIVCSNLGALQLAIEKGFEVMGGFGLNIFNSYSVKSLADIGVFDVVLSPELSFREIGGVTPDKKGGLFAFCYGRQPLMLTRNCPVKNGVGCKDKNKHCTITDRKREVFPVVCRNGLSEILNCRITDISDSLDELLVDNGYIYFTLENPIEVKTVLADLLFGKKRSGGELTHALFKTGVK